MNEGNKLAYCECCGAKMVEYKHSISKSLLRVLVGILRVTVENGCAEFEVCQLIKLTHNQLSNMHKLKYWGLIEKPPGDDNEGKGGCWVLTEKALKFLRGEIQLQKYVVTYRNSVQRFEGECLLVWEVTGGWWYRPDYVSHSKPHHSLGTA